MTNRLPNNQSEDKGPIVLKVIRRRVDNGNGTTSVGSIVVDKASGRPVAGIGINGEVTLPMWTPQGIQHVRYLLLGLAVFDEETVESNIVLPE
jgi:hypothetical protein